MTVFIIRGGHVNQFELQNYEPIAKEYDIHVVGAQHTLTPVKIPVHHLWSPYDLPQFPFRRQLLNRLFGGEQWLIGLGKYIKNFDYSNNRIIHTAETYAPSTHQAVQLRKKGLIDKLVCTCWETIPRNNEKFTRLRQWKSEAYQYVDIFHTPTERAKQALVTEGMSPKKIKVIPYGVDLKRFTTPERKQRNKRPVILTIARLEEEKGMKIIEKVAAELLDYDFRVIGEGSCIPKGANISVQHIPYTKIHEEYQRADVFLFPSQTTPTWEEQYGMALVEAMACGLPIVASDKGAIPEVVGNAGIICHTKIEMGKKLRCLIENSKMYTEISKAVQTRSQNLFNNTTCSRELAKLY